MSDQQHIPTRRRWSSMRRHLLLLLVIFAPSPLRCEASVGGTDTGRSFFGRKYPWQEVRQNGSGSTHSIPALNVIRSKSSSDVLEVAAVKQKKPPRQRRRPRIIDTEQAKKAIIESGGFYYGVSTETLTKATKNDPSKPRPPKLTESMDEALKELRFLREEMGTVKQELKRLKSTINGEELLEEENTEADRSEARQRRRRQRKETERIARDVERWAEALINESEEDGWKPVSCNKMMKRSLNPTGRTTVFLKVRCESVLVTSL